MSNGGNPSATSGTSGASGKVRPAWLAGHQAESGKDRDAANGTTESEAGTQAGAEAGAVITSPQQAEQAGEAPPGPGSGETTEDLGGEILRNPPTDHGGRVVVTDPRDEQSITWNPLEEESSQDADSSELGEYPYRSTSGKENARGRGHREGREGRGGIRSAISAFVGRVGGKGAKHSRKNSRKNDGKGVDGARGEHTSYEPQPESPAEVERRLKLSLRETGIRDFCRVCFGSPKGGVGKSSLAYAVAGALAEGTNLRVCLVDADPNFGATRFLVPRPVESSVLDLAEDADKLERLADLRGYVSQNEQMGLDVILSPIEAAQIAYVDDLAAAYERIDSVLSRFYDLVVYDLGLGFRDEAIRRVLSLSDELVFVSDAEVIPNAQLSDALRYVEGLGVDLSRTTLAINHRLPTSHESAATPEVRAHHASYVRRVTEIPYDAAFSKNLNGRTFHVDHLDLPTRLGVLTTAGAALEGLRRDGAATPHKKVVSLAPSTDPRANGQRASSSSYLNDPKASQKGGM